jgi:hemin uptake protein HemP
MDTPHDFAHGANQTRGPAAAAQTRPAAEHAAPRGGAGGSPSGVRTPATATPEVQTIDSAQLLAGLREVRIVHAGETYRLLVTRNNRLILQK